MSDRHAVRVLVVEDNADSRETLRALLEVWGFAVEAVGDGLSGVQKALAWRPRAAVVDIGLPRLDGYEVARQARAALGGAVLLVALTGYAGPEDCERALAAGFDHHFAKPCDPDQLRRLLDENRVAPEG
jgi:CheY-like chemotaxis protein